MNQDRTFSPTIIDLSNEYRILVEDINDFNTSFFKDVYKQALNHVKEIVETNDIYRKKLEDENNHYIIDGLPDVYNNIIVFEGERGKGKSSAMLSFRKALVENCFTNNKYSFFNKNNKILNDKYNFVAFDVIDPSFFNGDETLFEIVVAKLFNEFKKHLNDNYFNRAINDDKKRDLVTAFQKVFEDIKCQNKKINVYEGDALDALIKLSTSSNLRKSFSQLLKQYLDVFGNKEKSNYLVLTIDDFDLNISGMYKMMEDIRRFLINENIIILMSCKLSQVQEATYLEFYNILFSKVNNIQVVDNIIPKEEIIQKGNKHIQKLIPSNRINKLRDLAIDYYDFEVNELSRFSNPFSFVLSNLDNEKERIIRELDSLKNISLKGIEDFEQKYKSHVIIGENFQRTFFKFFYIKNNMFICNRKDYVHGLVPHTFRDLYDIKKQVKGDDFKDYIKDLLLNKINIKRSELKEDNASEDNSFLAFYNFLYRSINFIETNDLALFNNYFISNIATVNEKFRATNGIGIEYLHDHKFISNSIPNSWIYSILYKIKDNNQQFDQNLEHILDLYILFFFLKNKDYVLLRENKNKLLSPTNSMFFQIDKDINKQKSNAKNFGYLTFNKVETPYFKSLTTSDYKIIDFFIICLISEVFLGNNNITPYKIFRFPKKETIKSINLPEIFNLELTRILQPDFTYYNELKIDFLSEENIYRFEKWFNHPDEITRKYVDLFYNPIFFDLFRIKLNQYVNETILIFNINIILRTYFDEGIKYALEEINNIYPYLNLKFEELIDKNPLLHFYHKNSLGKRNIDSILKHIYDSLEINHQKETKIKTDKQLKSDLKRYLKDWPNGKRFITRIDTLTNHLETYLKNPLCSPQQKILIKQLLLNITEEIKGRNNNKTELSDGLKNKLNIQVNNILELL